MSRRNRQKSHSPSGRVRIVSLAEMMLVREQLEKATVPGVDPAQQAAVITWASQYEGAYYYTRNRCLRRLFPKATEVVLFHGVPQSHGAGAVLAARKGSNDGPTD